MTDMDQKKEKRIEQNRNKNRSFHASRFDQAYSRIGDLTYEYNADTGLAYASPVRGVWNIVHIATLVPEGHQIFVCPTRNGCHGQAIHHHRGGR